MYKPLQGMYVTLERNRHLAARAIIKGLSNIMFGHFRNCLT